MNWAKIQLLTALRSLTIQQPAGPFSEKRCLIIDYMLTRRVSELLCTTYLPSERGVFPVESRDLPALLARWLRQIRREVATD
jgi:hypothetical protein